MKKWELSLLLALVSLPALFLMGAGACWLWREGWMTYVWFPLVGCLGAAYAMAVWRWRQTRRQVEPIKVPSHWTGRDQEAWRLVEERAATLKELDPKRLVDLEFYYQTAQEMALELARFYHPRARDPIGPVTLVEILSVIELAAHDLAEMTERYVPGGHLLTINDWRRAGQVTDWYQRVSNVYWGISAVFSPINTAVRYAASKVGLSMPWQMLQQELLGWFFMAFVHRTGSYLILLNSGRLRVGAKRYRELLAAAGVSESDSLTEARRVTVSVVGQVKSGKSSLVNALIGERRAATSVIPMTKEITRYEFRPPDLNSRLVLLDTAGYGHAGLDAEAANASRVAVQESDAALLVLHARDPARRADLELLRSLGDYFRSRPNLKMPPILGVLTHIDLLSPAMDWSPPYDWIVPQQPKAQSIHDAVGAAKEQLSSHVIDVVPVCAAEGKLYGVSEYLIPRLAEILDDARAVSLLRCLHAEASTGQLRRVFGQIWEAGKHLAGTARNPGK